MRTKSLSCSLLWLIPSAIQCFVPKTVHRRFRSAMHESETEREIIAPQDTLKQNLLALASSTRRGFSASKEQRRKAEDLIQELTKYNPTKEPAAPYYEDGLAVYSKGPSITGKWTLVYTDAPDITSLDSTTPTAKLGRIGQECTPPYIKNVIEWRRPDWAASLPFLAGNEDSRILQKVCTKASASPEQPCLIKLKLAGLELTTAEPAMNQNPDATLFENIQTNGLPMGLLQSNPLSLEGPLTAPFGECTVLFLDDEMRIIRTGQNYLAVNVRDEEQWF